MSDVIRAMREKAQVLEAQRYLLQQTREQGDTTATADPLVDAIRGLYRPPGRKDDDE